MQLLREMTPSSWYGDINAVNKVSLEHIRISSLFENLGHAYTCTIQSVGLGLQCTCILYNLQTSLLEKVCTVGLHVHVHVHHDLGMIIHSKEGLLPWFYLLTSHIYSLSVLMSLMHGSCGQLELASSWFASCKVKSSCMLAERRGE